MSSSVLIFFLCMFSDFLKSFSHLSSRYIKHAIELLSKSDHDILLRMYDPTIKEENKKRLRDMSNNYHPRMDEMLCNVGMKSRTTNIIPMLVNINGSGYFEDRRPPSHTDPYEAAEGIVKACVFGDLLMPEFKSLKNLTLLDHSNE